MKFAMRRNVAIGVVAAFLVGFVSADQDYFFKVNKGIDIYGRVYRELALNYVDELDPERLMRSGIDGMLGSLDPYTTFIAEDEGGEVDLLTTGKYGGIGITIGVREGYVMITSLMDGYAAQRQGLQVGDRILEIEGVSMIGAKPEQVRSLTRGEPGTIVHMKIEREGEQKPLEFAIVREEVKIKNISYAAFLDDGAARMDTAGRAERRRDASSGLAYVRLDRFSRGAGDELRSVLKDLQLKGTIKGLILDLRENPGGLLDAAVDVVDKFVPQGSLVVSTRGRQPASEKKYLAREEPIEKDGPLVVLVNRNSASASEIVAGAIQDLDRGVIMGTRTFGKGLVQTIEPLVYNTQLKITTAKYYTPSGRSIQEVDYMHRGTDGLFETTPDSLKRKFETARGRPVYEHGGVTPDSIVENREPSSLYKELVRKSMFFRFVTSFVAQQRDSSVRIPDDLLLRQFKDFVKEKNFSYEDPGELKLKDLRDIAAKESYSGVMMSEIEQLSRSIAQEKEKAFDQNRNEVLRALKMEIALRYEGERGRIHASLADDTQVQRAIELLKNSKAYDRLLGGR